MRHKKKNKKGLDELVDAIYKFINVNCKENPPKIFEKLIPLDQKQIIDVISLICVN